MIQSYHQKKIWRECLNFWFFSETKMMSIDLSASIKKSPYKNEVLHWRNKNLVSDLFPKNKLHLVLRQLSGLLHKKFVEQENQIRLVLGLEAFH